MGVAVNGLLVGLMVYAAYDFTNTRIIQSLREAEEEFHKSQMKRVDDVRAAAQKQIDAEDTANEAITRRVLQSLAERRKAYFDMVNETRTADQQLARHRPATMDKIVEAVEKKVHVLRNLAEEANRASSPR